MPPHARQAVADDDSERWIEGLRDGRPGHDEAVARLHALLLRAARFETALTPHQRDVLVSLALGGVPIDVLAENLDTTRGALYKTLHDARRKLRAAVVGRNISDF
jgi:RNA polymerase sigma-70 factor, ECF subfamily